MYVYWLKTFILFSYTNILLQKELVVPHMHAQIRIVKVIRYKHGYCSM